MTNPRRAPLRILLALGALVALALPVMPALGQGSTDLSTSTIKVSVDSPADGVDVQNGRKVNVGGWAADTSGHSGTTGVDIVRIYLDGPMDSGQMLGQAKYGGARNDVAGILGNNVYTNSGFDYAWTPQNVGLGQHLLFVYAHSSITDTWAYQTVSVNGPNFITPTPTPLPVQAPPPGQQGNQQYGPGNQQYGQQYGPPNPNQGPLTPYGGTYLYNGQGQQGFGNYGNGYGYMGGGYAGYGPPPMGPQCGGAPFSSSASYPVPCSGPRWQNGAPFMGF
jgi:hypothetical protein